MVVGLALAVLAWGQAAFQNLAPSADGSVLYFSSPLRMKGTDQFAHSKIFVWDQAGGVRLYDQKPSSINTPMGPGPTWWSRTAYHLIATSVSGDGETVAVTGIDDCNYGTPCAVSAVRHQSEIRFANGGRIALMGSASLSPDGRFAYLGAAPLYPFEIPRLRLRDLTTGQEAEFESWSRVPIRHGVANDGSIVTVDFRASMTKLRKWPSGEERELNFPLSAAFPMIDAAASRLLYSAAIDNSGQINRLLAFNLQNNRETELAVFSILVSEPRLDRINPAPFDITDDATLVAFIDFGQAWTVRPDGSGRRKITNSADPIVEVALSGNGAFLFTVTNSSRIARIELTKLTEREVAPATPFATIQCPCDAPSQVAPGEAYQLRADNLPGIARARLLGIEHHLIASNPAGIFLQAPFELPSGADWLELELTSQSEGPFVSSVMWPHPIEIAPEFSPAWHFTDRAIAALHEDFRGPVTDASPARPGEIVHAYGRGFGPVTPQPELGAAANANPLSVLVTPVSCEVLQGSSRQTADILFAGLAPGWIGLCQLDVRLPAVLDSGEVVLFCGRDDRSASGRLPVK